MFNFREILEEAIKNGGATLHAKSMKSANYKTGYMVSVMDFKTIVLNYEQDILEALEEAQVKALALNTCVGLWIDEGKIYIDFSKNFEELEEALEFAKANKQLAIWDIANNSSIYLDTEEA